MVNECLRRHEWDSKAMDTLRLLQMQSFEDRVVPDKTQWDAAIHLMEATLQMQLNKTLEKLQKLSASKKGWSAWLLGSGSRDEEAAKRAAVIQQLGLLVQTSQVQYTINTCYSHVCACVSLRTVLNASVSFAIVDGYSSCRAETWH